MTNVSVRNSLCAFLSTISFLLLICTQVLGDPPKSLLPKNSFEFKEGTPPEKISNPEQKTFSGDRVNLSKPKNIGVEVNKLKEIDPESIGTIDEASGGFRKTMWGDTPRPLIKKLLMMLPNKVYSRNLRLLYKRLILTTANIPLRNKKFNEADLLLIRAKLLFDAGYLSDFNSLIAVIPQKYQTENLAQLSTDVAFLNNNMNKACDITSNWFGNSQSKYWQKTLIFCDALNGNWDQVDFGIKLLVELKETDEVFLNLIQIMSGAIENKYQFEAKTIRPRDVAMLRAASLKLPEPGPILPAPWLLSSYIQDPGINYQTRLLLAEEAAALGVIDSLALSELYKSIPVTDEALNNAVTISLTESTPKARTLLYRATLRQQSNFGKAQAIQQAQTIARKNNLFLEMAKLYAPTIESMLPGSELGWFAPEIALLNTANVNLEQAKLWSALAIREATIDQQALQNWQKVWPLIRIMWGDSAFEWNDENLIHWKNSTTEDDPENLQKITALMYNLLYVLGEPIPPELWETLVSYSSPSGSTKSIFNNHRSIELATKKSDLAEAISIILISLGQTEFNSLSPQELVLIVDSVNRLGFSKEARQLAFEILLSQQL